MADTAFSIIPAFSKLLLHMVCDALPEFVCTISPLDTVQGKGVRQQYVDHAQSKRSIFLSKANTSLDAMRYVLQRMADLNMGQVSQRQY
eukprot:SAG31_NODE_1911_length_6936_cov_124.794501_8_plen_89_part_00